MPLHPDSSDTPLNHSRGVLLSVAIALATCGHAAQAGFEDCNGNGIDDAIDIAKGVSVDCQGDGAPDECQVSEPVRYRYDSGANRTITGPPGSVAGLVRFFAASAFPFVGGVEFAGLDVPAGTLVRGGVWSDPDGDGVPDDAVLLAEAEVILDEGAGGRVVFDRGVEVGSDGTSFFVGIWVDGAAAAGLGFDDRSLARQSWRAITPGVFDPTDPGAALLESAGDACGGCDGDWAIRALACDQPWCVTGVDVDGDGTPDACEADCNENGVPDDDDIAGGSATDCNGNAIPDECEDLADCDGDGLLDVCTLLPGSGLSRTVWDNQYLFGGIVLRDVSPNIDFDGDDGESTPGVNNFFAVEWNGGLTPPVTGTYQLRFSADDRFRAWIDGVVVLGNNDDPQRPGEGSGSATIELEAGVTVAFRGRYYEDTGGERCRLWWTPPGGVEEIVPMSAFTPAVDRDGDGTIDLCAAGDCNENGLADDHELATGVGDCNSDGIIDSCQPELDCDGDLVPDSCLSSEGSGLAGAYFRSPSKGVFGDFVLARVDPEIFFDWGGGSPDPAIPSDGFAVRWTGTLVSAATGTHRFRLNHDDGARMFVDGVQVVDDWNDSGSGQNEFDLDFNTGVRGGGRKAVRIEYYENAGSANMRFRWRPPGADEFVPVPATALVPMVDVDGDGLADPCSPDCDGDGISDATAIGSGLSEDCNGNGVPDECDLGFEGDDVVAWWRFEDSADPGRDEGPYGLHLDVSGASASADVPAALVPRTEDANLGSTAYDFSHRLTTLDPDRRLSLVTERFTAEAWVRLDERADDASDPATRQWLFQRKNPTSDGRIEWAFLVQSGNIHDVCDLGRFGPAMAPTGRQLAMVLGTGSGEGNDKWCILSALQIEDGDWHHVSVGWDPFRREVRFELDGVVDVQSFELRDLNPNAHRFAIGAHVNGSGNWNQGIRGRVDEARIRKGIVPLDELLDVPYAAVSEDANADGTPDECAETPCPADLDGDGVVGGADLGLLFVDWGACPAGCAADLDGDGQVGGSDLGLLFVDWGGCP